jgi:hypothetical protein
MIFKKVRLGIERTEDKHYGVLFLDMEQKGHVIVNFDIEEKAGETVAQAHDRLEAQAREILRDAAEADFSWGPMKRC